MKRYGFEITLDDDGRIIDARMTDIPRARPVGRSAQPGQGLVESIWVKRENFIAGSDRFFAWPEFGCFFAANVANPRLISIPMDDDGSPDRDHENPFGYNIVACDLASFEDNECAPGCPVGRSVLAKNMTHTAECYIPRWTREAHDEIRRTIINQGGAR